MTDLRTNWVTASLGDVCQFIRGIAFPSADKHFEPAAGLIACLRTKNVQKEVDWSDLWFIPASYVKNEYQQVVPGDILISSANSYDLVGKVALVRMLEHPSTFGAFIGVIRRAEGVDPSFLYYRLSAPDYQNLIRGTASQTTNISNISTSRMLELPFSLPPQSEQRRIVAKLDALFEKSHSIREKLDRLPRLLANLQKSILNSAIASQTLQGESVPLSSVLTSVKTGPFGSSLHKSDYVVGGIPVINPMHIANGQITPSANMSVSSETMSRLIEFTLRKGDVVIGRRGEMGRCAVVTTNENGWLCGTGSMVLTPSDRLEPEYLQLFLSSPQTVSALELSSVGSTMVNLNQRILLNLEIPLPDRETQQSICEQVAKSLEAVDRFAKLGATMIGKRSTLDDAILSKAFRGELVPQNPNDEPASVLLERIRAQKPAVGVKRGRGRKAAA